MSDLLPEELKNLIKIPKTSKKAKTVADLPVTALTEVGRKEATALKKILKVSNIKSLSEVAIGTSELKDLIKADIRHKKIEEWISIAKKVTELDIKLDTSKPKPVKKAKKQKKKAKRSEKRVTQAKETKSVATKPEISSEPTKILLVGLSNAGKTSILNVLQNNVNLEIFCKLPPTKGVNREFFSSEDTDLVIWDMGGQDRYRDQYLDDPERFFLEVQFLIYVIDVQDPDVFDKSLEYLKNVLNALDTLKEKPGFLVLLHKYDPDVKDRKEIVEAIEFLTEKVTKIFSEKNLEVEILKSSIYNSLGKNPRVVEEIRNFLSVEETGKGYDKETLGQTLERVLNLMIGLSTSIEDRFTTLEYQMAHVREWIEYFRLTMPMEPRQKKVKTEVEAQAEKITGLRRTVNEEIKEILKFRRLE
ncbi:MAG: ADP-ribosylation factor-like protein [Candidatus Helarchaeota archaeon]